LKTRRDSSQRAARDGLTYLVRNPILVVFIAIAVGFRVLFQVITDRTWEDALILDSVTRNFWAGNGLTHQTAEEPIQSFSSVIWMIFSLVGNSANQGILFLKFVSLASTVATIWLAFTIAKKWDVSTAGIILILGFLSIEQVHVTFGSAGMESQFATAFILFGILSLVMKWRIPLMLTATLAPLVRPELVFWSLLVLVIYVFRPSFLSWRAAFISITPAALWLFFAWSYFGTVIPQTVSAKSLLGTTNLSRSGLFNGLDFSINSWERIAPYYSNYFASNALIPRSLSLVIVIVLVILFLAGVLRVGAISSLWVIPAAIVPMFALYVGFFNVSNYHMWYVPPFSAVLALYAGAAFTESSKSMLHVQYAVTTLILSAYLIPAISYFQYESYVQKKIDITVRQATGEELNSLMKPGQTAILEPLGFLGKEVSRGQVIDYPGLASRIMSDALRAVPVSERNMGTSIQVLQPDFVVVRENEWQSFTPDKNQQLNDYKLVARLGVPADGNLEFWGSSYSNSDRYFEIYAR